MSESMKCDACGISGRRRRQTLCPEGWFYALSTSDEGHDQYIIATCSPECRDAIWRQGPGVITAEELLSPMTPPPAPISDPEEIFDALVETVLKRKLLELNIHYVSGKFMITTKATNGETYAGLDKSVVEALREAFLHQDKDNEF